MSAKKRRATAKRGKRKATTKKNAARKKEGDGAARRSSNTSADPAPEEPPQRPEQVVVGIGASAGGLEAYKKFFSSLPEDSGLAFVVVQHLDPTHKSIMADLVGKYTSMPVTQVNEPVRIEANRVYMIPPDKYLAVEDGRLHPTVPTERRGMRMAIDFFLRSLAEHSRDRAACVILSGTGTDGALGLKAIKEKGGMAMVQDPDTADYSGMPRASIATGLADYVLPIEAMPEALLQYLEHYCGAPGRKARDPAQAESEALDAALSLLRNKTKHDFRCYKKTTLSRRVRRRASLHHLDKVEDYLQVLQRDEAEVHQLLKDLLISVTSFFREPETHQFLRDEVIRRLLEEKAADQMVRAWVPGCATGEEAYSIAMLFAEQMALLGVTCPVQIFATDIDDEALEFARDGLYPESVAADVGPERLNRFFTRQGKAYRVNKQLREMVVFAAQNLVSDPPFSRLDLISCRNVLIYLEPEIQERIIELFHFALRENGYLLLGRSESVSQRDELFATVSKPHRVFRRIGTPQRGPVDFPIFTPGKRPAAAGAGWRPQQGPKEVPLAEIARQKLLEQFAPASVLVDRQYQILYFHGPAENYLQFPAGEPRLNLLDMLREGLRTKVRGIVHKALRDAEPAELRPARVKRDGCYHAVHVTAAPVEGASENGELVLVSFEDVRDPVVAASEGSLQSGEEHLVHQLEFELEATREALHNSIEDLENSNEELTASNEEIMSMNEELQTANLELETSKEELQSLNEELSTVNSQLESKVDELAAVNSDLNNLLTSTEIATLFLDPELCIRRFTPASTRLLSLIPADVGRPIGDISRHFHDDELIRDARQVLKVHSPSTREVEGSDGRHFLRRILPYRDDKDRASGVVITFLDVTDLKRAEEEIAARVDQLRRAVVDAPWPTAIIAEDGEIVLLSRTWTERTGYAPEEIRTLGDWTERAYGQRREEVRSWIEEVFRRGERVEEGEFTITTKSGEELVWEFSSAPLGQWPNGSRVLVAMAHDVTAQKRAEREIKTMNERLEQLVQERTGHVELLQDIAVIANESDTLHQALQQALDRVCDYMRWPAGHAYVLREKNHDTFVDSRIWSVQSPRRFRALMEASRQTEFHAGEGLVGRVASKAKPMWIQDVTHEEGFLRGEPAEEIGARACLMFPVLAGRNVVAVLEFFALEEEPEHNDVLAIMRHVGTQLGRVVERHRLQGQLVDSVWQQQRRFGQDLHDGLGQELTGISMLMRSLLRKLEERSAPELDVAQGIYEHVREAHQHVRRISRGMLPVDVVEQGLMASLEELANRTESRCDVKCSFVCPEPVHLEDNNLATQLFRIAQEAVNNAVKHADAGRITVELERNEHLLRLTVRDDGRGIPDDFDERESVGIASMRYRAGVIDAELSVQRAGPDGGTIVAVTKPDHWLNRRISETLAEEEE